MTFPIRIEVDAGDHFCFQVALPENDAYVLIIVRGTFQCITGAGPAIHIAFFIIDGTVFHDLLHFRLGYIAALHPAFRMLSVFDIRNTPVKPMIAINSRCRVILFSCTSCSCCFPWRFLRRLFEHLYNKQSRPQYQDQYEWSPFFIQGQRFG